MSPPKFSQDGPRSWILRCAGLYVAVFGILLAGCGPTHRDIQPVTVEETPALSPAPKGTGTPLRAAITIRSPMTLSNNVLPGSSRRDIYIRIQLYQGTYSEDWQPGAYSGTRYQGRFQIVIADSQGQTLSTTRLDELFPEPMIFTNHFALAFDDYNEDGFPDFTLGQRASGNGGEYKILTIGSDDLNIHELPVHGSRFLYASQGEEGGSNYSVKLRKSKNGLISYSYYNPDQSQSIERTLQWSNGEFAPYKG
jgi:hypothetical protein